MLCARKGDAQTARDASAHDAVAVRGLRARAFDDVISQNLFFNFRMHPRVTAACDASRIRAGLAPATGGRYCFRERSSVCDSFCCSLVRYLVDNSRQKNQSSDSSSFSTSTLIAMATVDRSKVFCFLCCVVMKCLNTSSKRPQGASQDLASLSFSKTLFPRPIVYRTRASHDSRFVVFGFCGC